MGNENNVLHFFIVQSFMENIDLENKTFLGRGNIASTKLKMFCFITTLISVHLLHNTEIKVNDEIDRKFVYFLDNSEN